RTGYVLEREDQRCLIGPGGYFFPLVDEKEPSEVLFVVFQPRRQNLGAIFPGCLAAGDGRGIAQALRHDVLHAAGGVIKRNRRHALMPTEKIPALVERYRMR